MTAALMERRASGWQAARVVWLSYFTNLAGEARVDAGLFALALKGRVPVAARSSPTTATLHLCIETNKRRLPVPGAAHAVRRRVQGAVRFHRLPGHQKGVLQLW